MFQALSSQMWLPPTVLAQIQNISIESSSEKSCSREKKSTVHILWHFCVLQMDSQGTLGHLCLLSP